MATPDKSLHLSAPETALELPAMAPVEALVDRLVEAYPP